MLRKMFTYSSDLEITVYSREKKMLQKEYIDWAAVGADLSRQIDGGRVGGQRIWEVENQTVVKEFKKERSAFFGNYATTNPTTLDEHGAETSWKKVLSYCGLSCHTGIFW